MTTLERLHEALTTWAASHAVRAEVQMADLVIRTQSDERPVHLYETAVDELTKLVDLDTAARIGHRKMADTWADELVLAALRIRRLTADLSFGSDNGAVHPRARYRLWAALRRLQRSAGAIAAGWTTVLTEYARTSEAYAALDELLEQVEYAEISQFSAGAPPFRRDSVTLTDQFLLVWCPGTYGSTIHIRIFRPVGRRPLVVLGELVDYHSPGLVEAPDKYLAEIKKRVPLIASEEPVWVHYLPAGYVEHSERNRVHLDLEAEFGVMDSVRLIDEDPGNAGVEVEGISFDELERLVDGPVRRWHAADYRTSTLTGLGVRTIDALTKTARATHAEPVAQLQCRRLLCHAFYTWPMRTIPKARCPECGSATVQILQVFER